MLTVRYISTCIININKSATTEPNFIKGTEYSICYNKGEIEVNDLKLKGGIYVNIESEVTLNNCEIRETTYGLYSYGGNINANNCNIYAKQYGVYNNSVGTVGLTGGKIEVTYNNYNSSCYGIYNYSTGTINVSNMNNIKVMNSYKTTATNYYLYGVYNNSTGTINLEYCNIDAKNETYTDNKLPGDGI